MAGDVDNGAGEAGDVFSQTAILLPPDVTTEGSNAPNSILTNEDSSQRSPDFLAGFKES